LPIGVPGHRPRNTGRVAETDLTTSRNLNLQSPPQSPLSSGAMTPEEVHHQRNDRYYQQKVNQSTRNVECEKSEHPHDQQNKKQCQKH
jgi:hypothetical protein